MSQTRKSGKKVIYVLVTALLLFLYGLSIHQAQLPSGTNAPDEINTLENDFAPAAGDNTEELKSDTDNVDEHNTETSDLKEKIENVNIFKISEKAKKHILYGDETGGGHYYTVTIPCKSLFPENWSPEKIISYVEKIAANDNLDWVEWKNGNKVAQSTKEGIVVRVVMNNSRSKVITSYPLNAKRTPCPTKEKKAVVEENPPANDNSDTKKIDIQHRYNHNP